MRLPTIMPALRITQRASLWPMVRIQSILASGGARREGISSGHQSDRSALLITAGKMRFDYDDQRSSR